MRRRLYSKVVKRISTSITALVLAVTGMSGATPLFLSQKAFADSATLTVCSAGCDYSTVAGAVTGAAAGDTIFVNEDQTITSTILVNKQLTITSPSNATITTNGGNLVFTTTANGVVISNLNFNKSDKVNQNLINVQGDDTTVTGNTFSGQYTLAENDHTSRALDVSGTAQNLVISGNTFTMLRQPAYLNNGSTGTISTNETSQTRGWVVEAGTSFDFVDNTWGANSNRNAIDIAIIAGSPNNYTDVVALSEANNNASVQNQVSGVFSTVYVDAGAAAGGNGYWQSPYQTITSGLAAVAAGGTVEVAAGTYTENVNVNKAATIQGAGAATTNIVATNANSTPLVFSGNNATVDGFTITHDYTPSELSAWNFNNNGVQFGQLTTGNTVSNSTISLSRNGVYINNAQGNKLINNNIINNRTGINMTNNVDNTVITGNTIADNWTIGLVMYTATPSLTTDLSTLDVSGNTFDQNWYTEVLVKDANFSGALELSDNTFTDDPVTYSTSDSSSLNEPGFAAQQPVSLGGTATKPADELPTLRIYNSPDATLSYSSASLDISSDTYVLSNDDATVTVPQDAVITPANPGSWNGVVYAPQTITSGVDLPSGATLGVAIEVGSPDTTLTFSKAVKLVFPGHAGKLVGWQAPGSSAFTLITTDCSVYSDLDADMPAGGDCKTTAGSDLVVWTKHFTAFATFTPDTTKPAAVFTDPLNASVHKGLVSISADASDSESGLNNLQIVMRDGTTNAVVGNWSYNVQTGVGTTIQGTGTISFLGDAASGTVTVQNVNTAALTTGKYNLRLFMSDVAGNGNSAVYNSFFADNSSPDGSIVAPTVAQKGNTTITLNLTENGMAGLGVQQLVMRDGAGNVAGNWSYNVKTGATQTISGPAATFNYVGNETSGQLDITFDSSSLSNGTYSLRLFTKDQLGNGRSNIYGSVKFDNVAPGVTFSSPAAGSTVRDLIISATFEGTGSNMKQYGFDVAGPGGLNFSTRNYQVDQSTVTLIDFDLCAAQYYGDSCPSNLPDGTYTIRAKAYDKAGNRNISTYLTLVVDRSAPDGSFVVASDPVSGTTIIRVDLSEVGAAGLGMQQVVLRDSANAVVGNWTYNVPTSAFHLIAGNGTATYTGNEQSGSLEISFDTTGLDGIFNLRLFTKDQLNNGRSNIYDQLTIDNTAPNVTVDSYTGTDTTPTLTGAVDDLTVTNMTITIDGGSAQPVTVNGDGTWEYDVPTPLGVGSHDIGVTAFDTAGNSGVGTATIAVTAVSPSGGDSGSGGDSDGGSTVVVTPTSSFPPLTTPQVLGANTTTGTNTDNTDPEVKGDSTGTNASRDDGKNDVNTSAFLGLGWWWLAVLAALAAVGYLGGVRRRGEQN